MKRVSQKKNLKENKIVSHETSMIIIITKADD